MFLQTWNILLQLLELMNESYPFMFLGPMAVSWLVDHSRMIWSVRNDYTKPHLRVIIINVKVLLADTQNMRLRNPRSLPTSRPIATKPPTFHASPSIHHPTLNSPDSISSKIWYVCRQTFSQWNGVGGATLLEGGWHLRGRTTALVTYSGARTAALETILTLECVSTCFWHFRIDLWDFLVRTVIVDRVAVPFFIWKTWRYVCYLVL